MNERNRVETQPGNRPPTTLSLFAHYRPEQIDALQGRLDSTRRFRASCITSTSALLDLMDSSGDRSERVYRTILELRDQQLALRSSRSCGAVYLKMNEELSDKGLSPNDRMSFFLQCLEINTQLCTSVLSQGLRASVKAIEEGRRKNQDEILLQDASEKPAHWFSGGKNGWGKFLVIHSNFVGYLNPLRLAEAVKNPGNIFSRTAPPDLLGFTIKNEVPDWLEENEDELPERSVVEQELAEDTQQETNVTLQMGKAKQHIDYLTDTVNAHYGKSQARIEVGRRRLAGNLDSFPALLLYLAASRDIYTYTIDPPSIARSQKSILDHHRVEPEKATETSIHEFIYADGSMLPKELIALWIEQSLMEGTIINNAQAPVSDHFIGMIAGMIDEKNGDSEALLALREGNKKGCKALLYDIGPLFTTYELDYIRELAQEIKDKPDIKNTSVEGIIWEMAELISGRFEKTPVNGGLEGRTTIALKRTREFAQKWIRRNWQWALGQLETSLTKRESVLLDAQTQQAPLDTAPESEEIQTLIQSAKHGNLKGWNIFYAPRRTGQTSCLEKIAGQTLDERDTALAQYIAQRGISCSIKPSSIINALEWLVNIPEGIEQTRMRQHIGDEVFRKIKRGPIRILYQISHAERQIVFFLHQKKDWGYGF